MLTKEQIKNTDDIQQEELFIPEWGDKLIVRGLTAKEFGIYQDSLIEDGKATLVTADVRLCILSARDADGNYMFDDSDTEWLEDKSSKPTQRISKLAQKLSGMNPGDLDEMVKNSGKTPTEDSD